MSKSNMFDEAVEQREREQSQVQAVITGNAPEKTERTMKMTFSISPKDRILVRLIPQMDQRVLLGEITITDFAIMFTSLS